MAFCTNCGTKLEDGDKFCLICGYAVKAKEGKNLDIIIEKSVRLKGTKDDKTEISVFVPQRNRNYQILIPNSIEVGQSVRLRGEGLSDAGNRKGDLLVKITGIEYLDTELTTSVVLFGSEDGVTKIPVFLPHARKTVQVSIPNNINADQTLRLKGLGLRNERGEAGDLFLHFDHVNYTKEEDQPVSPPPQAEQQSTYTERKQEYAGSAAKHPSYEDAFGNHEESKEKHTRPPKEDQAGRRVVYDGPIHKCPNCGEIMNSFVAYCPSCGYEIRSVRTNSPVEALVKKIEQVSSTDEKIELIANFYIPNTKEDIFDFFILAVSNLEDKWYDTDDAWRAKLEQAYHKAKLSFGNTPEFDCLEKLYTRTRKEVNKRERGAAAIFRRNKVACITALLIGGGIIMLVIGIALFAAGSPEENFGISWGGLMFAIIGINFLIAPTWVLEEMRKKEGKGKKKSNLTNNSSTRTIGKDHDEFYRENYDDMTEYLKARGFRNVIAKPVRKGLLDTEGAIEGISVAGNTEFDGDDEFDIDSTIILRYYSRKR